MDKQNNTCDEKEDYVDPAPLFSLVLCRTFNLLNNQKVKTQESAEKDESQKTGRFQ